jgi:predicted amidohydrolase YtcJ
MNKLAMSAAFLLLATSAHASGQPSCDVAFVNGVVYTLDAARSWATAVGVTGHEISYVGDGAGVKACIDEGTLVIDLHGRMLLPGFQDSHVHPMGAGQHQSQIQLDDLLERQAIFDRIRGYVQSHADDKWILGGGWYESAFLPAGSPTREMLDAIVSDRPALIRNASGHQAWVNSRALAIAGITAQTPNPPGGRIEHEKDGSPSGILSESAAKLVSMHVPQTTVDERAAALRLALGELSSFGVTSIMDARVSDDVSEAYDRLAQTGGAPLRATLCQYFDPTLQDEAALQKILERRAQHAGSVFPENCVKIFLDGIIEHHTGLLLAPYFDDPKYGNGPYQIEPARLNKIVIFLAKHGLQLHFHAIGDGAAHEALDAIEAAERAGANPDARHTIAHLQLIDGNDIPRFRELGVVANMTPLWGHPDAWMTVLGPRALGPERSRGQLPSQTLISSGATLVWGTDWPVTSALPLEGIETAVTRRLLGGRDAKGHEDKTFEPEQRVSLADALAAYTINGAYLLHEEATRGSIERGKAADLVILSENLFRVAPERIHTVQADMTMLGGRIVFERTSAEVPRGGS